MSGAGVAGMLSCDNLAFIQKGISICVASRDVRLVPSLSRALACRLSDDGLQIRIILVVSQSQELVRDVERSGAIAVVFTEPSTHRTLQIKGVGARLESIVPADLASVEQCHVEFREEIGKLGFDTAFTARMFAVPEADLAVITFAPDSVFEQTPGPNAGAPLEPPL